MSSASSAVTYTSVCTDSEPGRVLWGADEELSDGGSPRVIVYGYDGLPMQPVAPPSPDYVPGPEHPPSPVEVPYIPEPEYPEYLVPSDDEAPMEDQPLPADASPVALSPGYVADSDPEEDPEEDHADYPADGGDDDDEPSDDDDDDDDTDDKDEEPFEDEADKEHLAPADSPAIPVTDLVPSVEDTEAFETDEAAPTHVPSPRRHTARMFVRPQTPVPFPSEAEVERLLALPIPPPSLLTLLSSPLPQIPSPPLPPPPSSLHLPPLVPISLPLPLSPLPPLRALLSIPPVNQSSTTAPRPTGGHRVDYRFIGTLDAEARRQRAKVVGYRIRDTWVDLRVAAEEYHYEIARLLDQEALVSQEAWAHSVGLSLVVHYELQGYRTHIWIQDHHIDAQESLIATLVAQVSSLHGHLATALGEIRALQARDQTHADAPKGAGSSA
ncbi:hypothetical protein Tco_1564133 [Tanacetum coccineum]